jgi:hypothetical protein
MAKNGAYKFIILSQNSFFLKSVTFSSSLELLVLYNSHQINIYY